MRDIAGEWISNLAIIAILAALVDMVLPNGNLRKYTGFLFGLVILIMFLQPILQWTGQELNLEHKIMQGALNIQTQAITWQIEDIENNQQKRLENMLQENLENELEVDLKYNTGLENINVDISFAKVDGKTDFSNIQRIDVTVVSSKQTKVIEAVNIDIGMDINEIKENSRSTVISKETILELRQYLSNLYKIDPSLIYINGQ